MEKSGLITEMTVAVQFINKGRRGLYTKGQAEEGLQNFIKGHAAVRQLMKDVIAAHDPEMLLLAETVYLASELAEGQSGEQKARQSTDSAMRAFEDALMALRALQRGKAYECVDMAIPHDPQYRVGKEKDMPKDAYHIAFSSHVTRINNGLSRFGIAQEDRDLALVRLQLITAAQEAYLSLQRLTLA